MQNDSRPGLIGTSGRRTRRGFLRDLARLGGGVAGLGLLPASCAPTPSPSAPPRVFRVGLLGTFPAEGGGAEQFWGRMAELGYVEGTNLLREERGGDPTQLNEDAAELVRRPVDVIVATGLPNVRAAMNATTSIPIVMMGGSNPVVAGLVDSLTRPGGNVTGISAGGSVDADYDLDLKRLELLLEAAPGISRVAVLGGAGAPGSQPLGRPEARSAARSLGVDLLVVPVLATMSPADFEAAFERLRVEGAEAMVIPQGGIVNANAPLIANLVERYGWPAISGGGPMTTRGVLLTYAARGAETRRRAADYVDRILRGARPAELPFELAQAYDLIVNLRTARALGLTLSPDFLAQVTEVIDR